MKHYLGLTDVVAGAGILGSVFKVFPEVIGAVAAFIATIYYAILIYDRLRHKK